MISSMNRPAYAFRSSKNIPIPVSKEVVVIVTAAELLPTDTFPPNTGGVDGHPIKDRSWKPHCTYTQKSNYFQSMLEQSHDMQFLNDVKRAHLAVAFNA